MFTFSPSKILSAMALLVVLLGSGLGNLAVAADPDAQKLAKADAAFAEGREALNRSQFQKAAELMAQSYELSRPQMLAGDALYWEAFARFRLERTEELKQAVKLLRLQQEEYREAATAAEGEGLAARIYAKLAERGEADAAREITMQANERDIRLETRTAALQALMQMDPRKAMPILKKIALDATPENLELRRNAIFIMCREGGAESEDLLIDLLTKETDPEFLSEIVMCLSMNQSDRGMKAVMDLFRTTKDPQIAEATLMSLGHHGGDEVFAFLLEVAQDKSREPQLRAQALMALSMTGRDREVTDLLVGVLETENDHDIMEMALMALSRIDDPAAAKAIMNLVNKPGADEEFKAMALHFATINGGVDLATLDQLYLNAKSRDLKQQICHVLTMAEDQDKALDLLIKITRTETDPTIKRDAVFWIGQFDSERAADYLLEVINEK